MRLSGLAVGITMGAIALCHAALPPDPEARDRLSALSAAVLASALSALMEASTTQLDNVFLPLHHLAALGALARLLS